MKILLPVLLFIILFLIGTFIYRRKIRKLMTSRKDYTLDDFLREFKDNETQLMIAHKTWNELVSLISTQRLDFKPSPQDRLVKDCGIASDEIEDLLHAILHNYNLPSKQIKGSDKEVITVRDLIEFAVAVTENYSVKVDNVITIKEKPPL